MNSKSSFPGLLILLVFPLLISGCGIGLDLNIKTEQKTGPTVTDQINIPAPDVPLPLDLSINFGAGTLRLLPNPGADLLAGTASYNVTDFKPVVETTETGVILKQGNLKINAVPTIDDRIKNEWGIAIGNYPADLNIKAGGYTGEFEFGGLSITDLHITDGAANVNLVFSTPNQTDMSALRYETGASNITMEKLANANFQTMIFQSGAGNYNLDFSGFLQRDAAVFIETGLSRVVISVPENIPAVVKFEGPLSKVTARGSWQESGQDYQIPGDGPGLIITVETKAGTVTLKNP